MGKPEKSVGSITVIGGSDGPTSVIFIGGKQKRTLKQKIQKVLYEKRKKRIMHRIKPGAHTMGEVVRLICDKYGFVEVPKDSKAYIEAYDDMRVSSLMQYAPDLLGEYVTSPELQSRDEEGFLEFQAQWELRKQKAREIPKEKFDIDLHLLKKKENEMQMHFEIEARFGHIGGGFSGPGKGNSRKFRKFFQDVYRYYGVTEADIADNSRRYQELVRVLAMRH